MLLCAYQPAMERENSPICDGSQTRPCWWKQGCAGSLSSCDTHDGPSPMPEESTGELLHVTQRHVEAKVFGKTMHMVAWQSCVRPGTPFMACTAKASDPLRIGTLSCSVWPSL